MESDPEEDASYSRTNRIAKRDDRESLKEDHPDDPFVRYPNGFQDTELFKVFYNEDVKSLTSNDRSDDQRDGDRDAEVHRNSSIRYVITNGLPGEVDA